MFFAMFDWYSIENEHGDPPDQAKYATWAMISVTCTAFVIGAEIGLYMVTGKAIVLYSGASWSDYWLFAWSLPLFLALNYFAFLHDNRGYQYVLAIRKEPQSAVKTAKVVGSALAVGIFLVSLVLTVFGPHH
jgi:hypothetical protein